MSLIGDVCIIITTHHLVNGPSADAATDNRCFKITLVVVALSLICYYLSGYLLMHIKFHLKQCVPA